MNLLIPRHLLIRRLFGLFLVSALALPACSSRSGSPSTKSNRPIPNVPAAAKFDPQERSCTVSAPLRSSSTFLLLSNPFSRGGNTVSEVLTNVPVGSRIYKYVAGNYQISTLDEFLDPPEWIPNFTLNPGEGFFLEVPPGTPGPLNIEFRGFAPDTETLVSRDLPAGQSFILVGSMLGRTEPQLLVQDLNYRVQPNDMVFQLPWGAANWTIHTFDEFDLVWYNTEPRIRCGEAVFIRRANLIASTWVEQQRANQPPVANAGPDRTAFAGMLLNFDGSKSSDPDGSIAEYAWDFGDGTLASGVLAAKIYSTPGTYIATLRVKDDRGATATDTALITVTAALARNAIGEPTAEEQQYLEFINRARADPIAEAQRWRTTTDPDILESYAAFGVDLNLMANQISALPPVQPLAFHAQLLDSARRHTRDQFNGGFQSHIGSDGSSPGRRISEAGYTWSTFGENVYGAARNVAHGHAAFEVDWGYGTGGMLTPAGHRLNIHNGNFREAGIAVMNGFNGTVGPQVVTQNFASRAGLTPLITGVVYYDLNGNDFYDPGEGLGGVQVTIPGAAIYAVTSASGGYALPVAGNGTYPVTFTAANLPSFTPTVTVAGGLNVKLDWRPIYSPAVISGPTALSAGQSAAYSFRAVGGALGYEWQEGRRVAQTALDDAESGTQQSILVVSPGYPVVQNMIRASGAAAFRLAHPQPIDQSMTWNWQLRAGSDARLEFFSRLGWATQSQAARVQVSANGGISWRDVWSRIGNSGSGQSSFERVSVSLAEFAGQEIQLRFVYDHMGGIYFSQTSNEVGWYFDDVAVSGCEQLVDAQIRPATSTSFSFTPTMSAAMSADYALRVRAVTVGGALPWGPALTVHATGAR